MATVTKPIALDESINTTESPSRNLADVLAQELSGIATAIGGGNNSVPKTDVATVEPSTVATRSYSVGDLVYVNGALYQVIASISQGSSFTIGTNIQATTIGSAIGNRTGHIELFQTLWENPNPSASFGAQQITLTSSDYDFLLWIYGTGSASVQTSVICAKGENVALSSALTNSTYGTTNIQRTATRTSDTTYSIGDGYLGRPQNAHTTDNTVCKPLIVYGFKKSLDITF